MVMIEQAHVPMHLTPDALWAEVVHRVQTWLEQRQRAPRDAVLLLPFADLLPLARQAFAAAGGWQPRIETLRTLAESLGPPPPAAAGAPSGQGAIDRLVAAGMLGSMAGLRAWRRRDPAGYEHMVGELVLAAQWLSQAAAARAPAGREAWWSGVRSALPAAGSGPAPLVGGLARLAQAWAEQAGPTAADGLHALRPSAWIVLQAGGADAAVEALLGHAAAQGTPVLALLADGAGEDAFDALPPGAPTLWAADDAEDEALAAATAVIDALAQGQAPVALVAEDRLLVRRIRALLERAGLRMADESGWTLSTTRAAAHLMALLRAVHPTAGPDEWLDALKAETAADETAWLDVLERHWRRGERTGEDPPAVQRALARWAECQARWQVLAEPQRRPLSGWLQALRALLLQSAVAERWQADPAGRGVWQALRLDRASARADVDGMPLSLDEFTRWAGAALDDGSYIPAVDRERAQVIITPLARAMLRPFGAVVLPGADERRLGPASPAPSLLGDALLREIGVPDRAARARRRALAFVQLLRHPRLLLVRRRAEGAEHLGPSPWVARLQLARRALGQPPLVEIQAPLRLRPLQPAPVYPPRADARGALPVAVSASAIEALRHCPYRFFARSVLRLGEVDELAQDPGKRDYGTLLHDALRRFHDERGEGRTTEADHAQLLAAAEAVAAASGLDGPAMLPFRAGMPAFARRYLAWLATHESAGWRYLGGEVDKRCQPAALGGLELRGRIDRIDRQGSGALQLIDYKTGSLRSLQDKVKQPLEDTQLAFYAAQVLAGAEPPATLAAAYLALDEREAIVEVDHPAVQDSAAELLAQLADEWARMAAGEALQALGEGTTCEHCEMRGLCRRDHWSTDGQGAAP